MKPGKCKRPKAIERDFSSLFGLISEVSDEEWAAMDQEILAIWQYSQDLDQN